MGVPTVEQFMTNLRQMWQRLTTGARDTTQSAGAYVDRRRKVMALRGDVRKARGARSNLYTVMGRKVYALHRKEKVANKDLLRSCQEIDELNTLIEAKQTQIEAILAAPEEQEIDIEDDTELPEDKGEPEEAEEEDEEQAPEEEPAEEKAEQE
jgi:hypothetical protein